MDNKALGEDFRPSAMRAGKMTLLLLLLASAGCTSSSLSPDPFLQTSSLAPEAETLSSEVSPEFAAAFLPSVAGSIQSVRQSIRSDGLSQQIVYSNLTTAPGENLLSIEVGKPESAEFLRPPTQRRIASEIRAVMPGGNAAISPVIRDNVQGAYGFATAALGASGSCLYAWQFIKNVSADDVEGYRKLTRTRFAAQIRLRYCHPSIPQDRIAVMMDGLRVKKMGGETIDLLRFAAGSAFLAAPPAIVTVEPAKVVRTAPVATVTKAVVEEEDWRNAAAVKQVNGETRPIKNAVKIPLPDETPVKAVKTDIDVQPTVNASDKAAVLDEAGSIPAYKAVLVPLPE